MPADLSPLQWVDVLERKLEEQRKHAQQFDEHYSGDREIELIRRDYAEVFGTDEIDPPRTNVSAVGVDALTERLEVTGFRVGDDDDQAGANVARDIWRRNDLDVMSPIAHTEAAVKAVSFALVWPDEQDRAVISIEDAEQMAVARRDVAPYDVIAALKVYRDWWDDELAVLYRPNGMYKFRARRGRIGQAGRDGQQGRIWTPPRSAPIADERSRWTPREPEFTPAPTVWNGRVPVVELANRQRLMRAPASEIKPIAPLADAHTKLLSDLVLAASFGAIPVRTATGVELPQDPRTGEKYSPFDVRADRMMLSEDSNARFGTLQASDLAGYVAALDLVIERIMMVTRAPKHYYGGGGQTHTSGETLKASEATLVRRIQGLLPRHGMAWPRVIELALAVESDEYRNAPVMTRWGDVETRIEAQSVDAAAKLKEMGVPLEVVLERIGFDAATVRRAMRLRVQEVMRGEELLNAVQRDVDSVDEGDTTPAEDADESEGAGAMAGAGAG